MPNPSIKDEKTYRGLREVGASKEKAARIANASAAQDGLAGRSRMSKSELIRALRSH